MKQTVNATYTPPTLPEYLKKVSDLKPIVGSPGDNEVQGIHAVLRMAHHVINVPGMFDPELLISLSQHLFEVQMARYREKHPSGMFPEDIVHTPPTLPSHISVSLEPVHGVPSDKELQSVQAAIRANERISIVPSMFDPKVGMELSQHLFNIQFARYMHNTPKAELGRKSKPRSKTKKTSQSSRSRLPVDPASDVSDEEPPILPDDTATDESLTLDRPPAQYEPIRGEYTLGVGENGSEGSLGKLVDTLEGIRQVLVSSNQSTVRGSRHAHWRRGERYYSAGREMMNDKGILPTTSGLPRVGRDGFDYVYRDISDNQLAQYLQFYGIGQDLIVTGDTPTIREGQRSVAEAVLSNFIN